MLNLLCFYLNVWAGSLHHNTLICEKKRFDDKQWAKDTTPLPPPTTPAEFETEQRFNNKKPTLRARSAIKFVNGITERHQQFYITPRPSSHATTILRSSSNVSTLPIIM